LQSPPKQNLTCTGTLFVLPTYGAEATELRKRILTVPDVQRSGLLSEDGAGQSNPLDLGWTPPSWQCLGGCFTSSPTAILDTSGFVHVFARGCDRALWRLSQQGQPKPLQSTHRSRTPLPFLLPVDRGAPAKAVERRGVVAALQSEGADGGGDGEIVGESAGVSWGEWVSMGGVLTGSPTLALDSGGMLHVFCRGITRALTHLRQRWNGTQVAWEQWESLGGVLASSPQQGGITDGANFLNVYVRGGDKAVWRKFEQASC